MGKQVQGMRAIDLDFIQKLIRSMDPTEQGKIHTIMVSDDYCKRSLVSGLGPFVVMETPQESYLLLTGVESYYHARIYFESLDHFPVITLLTDDEAEIAGIYSRLKNHPGLVLPKLRQHYLDSSPYPTRTQDNTRKLYQFQDSTQITYQNKTYIFCRKTVHYNAIADTYNKSNTICFDLEKDYELPITSISEDLPGIKL